MRIIGNLARILLGSVFVYASIDKMAFPGEFTLIIKSYRVLPEDIVPIIALVSPWMEMLLGAFLISGIFMKVTSRIALVILLIFLFVICARALTGEVGDCGCFGESSFLSTSNTGLMILRDLLFLGLAVLVLLSTKGKSMRES